MRIHYRETEYGIEIMRCFGADGNIELPGEISGKPVTRAAAYAFSARKDYEEEDTLICETEEGRLFRHQERLLAGENVESLSFPDTMTGIGKYIFYGCRNLRELSFSDSLTEIGSGAFTGCRALGKLNVSLINGKRSCVPEILGDLWQRIDVDFYEKRDGREAITAKLVFPEHYEEAVENTPARILFTQHHGSGNNYRQCFYNKEIDYRKYDELFFVSKAQDQVSVLADLIFGRLLYPAELGSAAEESYQSYVREHGAQISAYLTDAGDMDALREMSRRGLWTENALDAAVDHAAACQSAYRTASGSRGESSAGGSGCVRQGRAGGTGQGEILSFLMDEKHRLFPVRKGKYEL